MNTRRYIYDVVVGPNPLDDSIHALDTLEEFATSANMHTQILEFLPGFDDVYTMKVREVIPSKPKFRKRRGA